MRNFPILFVMAAAIASPAWAAKRVKSVTVFELTQLLSQSRGESDRRVARELSTLRLTQRISSARLMQWYKDFPGRQTQLALTELADASAFLNLPASEVSNRAAPDRDVQQLILHDSIVYVNRTTQQLPNFSALRTTLYFEDALALWAENQPSCNPLDYDSECMFRARAAVSSSLSKVPLRFTHKSSFSVTYRNGREIMSPGSPKTVSLHHRSTGLVTSGEFGPILGVVLGDALQGEITWGYWEQVSSGLLAVFRYTVPKTASHYVVGSATSGGLDIANPSYHGEIAVDPVTGAIHRITMVSDVPTANQGVNAAIMVLYGPVLIGGKSYICPIKAAAISNVPVFSSHIAPPGSPPLRQTMLNDITFTQFHIFRGQVSILPEETLAALAPAPAR